ncbi:MAG: helix-turn-helix domain-containing protein, partial [Candidatus Competibacteraceae bacterium]|nr:helix-turn-helix domain-containing protein [Candidatus Competibacteraceae bacterium]
MSAQNTAQSSQEIAQTYQTAAEALGATLAEARKRLGLEQREVATRLGLNPVLIRRLEEGAFQDLGAPVYARGYLTRYVRFLELPEQEILDRHKQLGVNEVPPLRVTRTFKPQARMSDRGVRWFSYLLLFAVIGWIGWQGYEQVAEHLEVVDESSSLKPFSNTDENAISLPQPEQTDSTPSQSSAQAPEPERNDSVAGAVLQEVAPLPVQTTTSADSAVPEAATDTASSAESVTTTLQTPSVETTTSSPPLSETLSNAATPATTPPASSTESASTPTPATTTEPSVPVGPPQLSLEFTEDCWVDVKDANGERLAYGIMKANTVSTVSGPAPFSITLGNAVGVSAIKLNGKPIEPSLY